MRQRAKKYPVLFSLGTLAVFLLLVVGQETLLPLMGADSGNLFTSLFGEAILAAGAFVLLWAAGNTSVLRRRGRGFFRGFLTGGWFLFSGALTLLLGWVTITATQDPELTKLMQAELGTEIVGLRLQPPDQIIAFVGTMLLIGVAEELVFRGVVAELLKKRFGTGTGGVWASVALSGVMFGAAHMVNTLQTGVVSATVQSMNAILIGMIFGAIYYINNNLWTMICIHAFVDFAAMAMNGGIYVPADRTGDVLAGAMDYSWDNLLSLLPLTIVLLVLMRKKNIRRAQENWAAEPA